MVWTRDVNLINWFGKQIENRLPINQDSEIESLLYSKVKSANYASDESLVIRMLLANKNKFDMQLVGTKVYLINFLEYKESQKITIIKESNVDYETVLLPKETEITYNFSITNDAFKKMKSGEMAIFSRAEYMNQNNLKQKLCIIIHYGSTNNELATYKVWYE